VLHQPSPGGVAEDRAEQAQEEERSPAGQVQREQLRPAAKGTSGSRGRCRRAAPVGPERRRAFPAHRLAQRRVDRPGERCDRRLQHQEGVSLGPPGLLGVGDQRQARQRDREARQLCGRRGALPGTGCPRASGRAGRAPSSGRRWRGDPVCLTVVEEQVVAGHESRPQANRRRQRRPPPPGPPAARAPGTGEGRSGGP